MRSIIKRRIYVITSVVVLAMLVYSGVKIIGQLDKVKVNANYTEVVSQPDLPGYQLIISSTEKNVFVYGKKIPGRPYYEQVLVKSGTKQKEFDWKASAKSPKLDFANVTGSGQDNIVVVFVTSYGTGLLETQAHVVDSTTLYEILFEDAATAVKRLVTASVQGDEILFKTDGKEFRVKPKVGAGGIQKQFSNLYYGSIVNYVVENNKLKSTITVETPYNTFLGEFTIVYSYKNRKLVPEIVNFISLI